MPWGSGDALVAMRLKRLPSIAGRLRRFGGMCLDRMQGIGGIRVIVGSVEDAFRLEDALRHGCCGHDLPEPQDYISDPKDDGYRGIRQILRIKSPARPEFDGLAVELQIRTVIEHSWATAVEALLRASRRAPCAGGEGSIAFVCPGHGARGSRGRACQARAVLRLSCKARGAGACGRARGGSMQGFSQMPRAAPGS